MAVAYGCRLGLGRRSPEAFIAAYCNLPDLRDPHAFPGWFRRIVIKHIDRIRRRRPQCIALDELAHVPGDLLDPADMSARLILSTA